MVTPAIRQEGFAMQSEGVPRDAAGNPVSVDTGCPGMSPWQLLVLGVLRLGLNADYDRIQEVANQHLIIRQRRGHGDVAADQRWGVQTLKDPRRRFTPEVLERIKAVVVCAGHALVKQARPRG